MASSHQVHVIYDMQWRSIPPNLYLHILFRIPEKLDNRITEQSYVRRYSNNAVSYYFDSMSGKKIPMTLNGVQDWRITDATHSYWLGIIKGT